MKKSAEIVVRFVSAVAFSILLVCLAVYAVMFFRCFHEIKLMPELKEYAAVHIQFYGSGTDTVSARIALCDTAGKEFAVIDRSWNGKTLSIDFTSVCFCRKEILFPYRVYSQSDSDRKRPVREGTLLSTYYMAWKKCLLLGEPCTDRQKLAMHRLASFGLMQASKIQTEFSRMYAVDLSGCRSGESYFIVTDSNGKLLLSQM